MTVLHSAGRSLSMLMIDVPIPWAKNASMLTAVVCHDAEKLLHRQFGATYRQIEVMYR